MNEEQSKGVNMDVTYRIPQGNGNLITLNSLLFYTRVDDPLELQEQGDNLEFTQPDGYVDTRGVEITVTATYGDFKLFLGYTHANVREHYAGTVSRAPLVSAHRIGLEAYYYGPQRLSDGARGKSYWVTGVMTEKTLAENVKLFLNFENFGDTRQTRFDTIYTGSLSNPQFRDIYAPLDGFIVNGGIKVLF